MKIIDSHQHFWQYEPVKHSWIDEEMKSIRRDFLPEELAQVYKENEITGSVVVEADQAETETAFLLSLAKQHPFIKGVVGFVELKADTIQERLEYFSQFSLLKGFRAVL